ncbi:CcgAII protein [Proteus mirabilis]|uniref:CcgAII protein n=1 Tax=Proteus mirabilis TaxID=584 RepID=UPI0034D4068F
MLDIEYYRNLFNELSVSEKSRCGLVYELYQRRLSNEIDRYLNKLNQNDKAKVLELAKTEFDYLSQKEIDMAVDNDYMAGLCSHGLDPDCCPLGCGDL